MTAVSTALVTGATSGLGRGLAKELSGRGWTVLVHGRDERRCAAVVEELRATGGQAQAYVADLAELRQVAELANRVAADHPGLGLLINNAGVGSGGHRDGRQVSADGYELRLAVNYLAPVLLTRLLHGQLRAAAPSQVLNIGSVGQSEIDFADPQFTRRYDGMEAYTRSKFALAAFTFATAAQYEPDGITVNCSHPANYMDTAMVREAGVSPWTTVAAGCRAALYALDQGAGETGVFYNERHAGRAHRRAYDAGLQRQLLALTDELIGTARGVDIS
ncbi:SDR family NAD(P)-dependent oxidoreductase [Krasilnikovia sp. MM14-A1259]|uniref:SDR family NAD(P)-dependent oxidoreductase n=1 Tax=Krasilnikovia sp. MM14-A1259 TaxID=3373539 RepID=UPI00382FA579